MISARPASSLIIAALRRKAEAEGGSAMVLAKGHEIAGAILTVLLEKGENQGVLERRTGHDGERYWDPIWTKNTSNRTFSVDMLHLRTKSDPDLWILELDIPDAERFTVEMSSIC